MSAKYQLQTSDSLPAALAESKLVLDFQKRLVALPEPWGRSVMALRVLRRHRFLPAVAGIVGALVYAWLAASHIVSQTAHASSSSRGAQDQPIHATAADHACNDLPAKAAKEKEPSRDHPDQAPSECPFCAGYAALHLGVVGGSADVLPREALPGPYLSLVRSHLAGLSHPRLRHARAPPS